MNDILDVLGAHDIMQAWGLSECGGLSIVSTDHPREKRLKSVGKALASAIVRIVESETLKDVPQGTQGEILLGDRYPGSCVGKGYYGMPDKTAEVITADGWFRTGDVGYLDEEGYLYVTGRVDDMFTVGGFNIYPVEIENKLEDIDGVREAFIVPIADHRLGSVPAAWICLDDGANVSPSAISEYCRRQMTAQKVSRRDLLLQGGRAADDARRQGQKEELTARTAALVEGDASAGVIADREAQS